jgi:hypothetical protein
MHLKRNGAIFNLAKIWANMDKYNRSPVFFNGSFYYLNIEGK